MNFQRNRRYFIQKDLSTPMSIIGGILCAVIGVIVIFVGMYSSYEIYYYGFPILVVGISLLTFGNSYYVKDREIDEVIAHELEDMEERFLKSFTLSDRDHSQNKISSSGFIFNREGLSMRRGRDRKLRSNLFYVAMFFVSSDRFYALSRSCNLTDETAGVVEQRVELRFSEITSLEHKTGGNATGDAVSGGLLKLESARSSDTLYVPDDAMILEAVERLRKKISVV